MEKRPVIIDCDPGVDDAFAILLAAATPCLDIRAINPVAGNINYHFTSSNALRLAGLLGLGCRVGKGATAPLLMPLRDSGGIHGANGMAGYELPQTAKTFDDDYAWDIMLQEAEAAAGALEIVALGPLTNLAIALLRYPQLKKMIKKITLMGGSAHSGNVSAYAEFNIWADPHAAEVVFSSGVPLAMVGFDACYSCGLTAEEFRAFALRPGKVTPLTTTLCEALLKLHKGFGLDTSIIFDMITVACYIKPEMATYRPCFVQIETQSSLSAGQTVVDWYHLSGQAPNVDVLESADKAAYIALLGEMMDHYA